jgi:hypothetical protein
METQGFPRAKTSGRPGLQKQGGGTRQDHALRVAPPALAEPDALQGRKPPDRKNAREGKSRVERRCDGWWWIALEANSAAALLASPRRWPRTERADLLIYANTSKPFWSTKFRSLSDGPLGFFWPRSHFCTVDGLVFK